MLVIDGKIVSGMRVASKNLELQMPHFLEVFPEISGCVKGTLNVQLNNPVKILNPHFITTPIAWYPQDLNNKEVFHFTRIEIGLLVDTKEMRHKAWVYGPQNSIQKFDPFLMEVLCEKVNLKYGDCCRIYIDKYRETKFIVI